MLTLGEAEEFLTISTRLDKSSLTLLRSSTASITTSVSSLTGRPLLVGAFFLGTLPPTVPLGEEKGDDFLEPVSSSSPLSSLRTLSS